MLRRHSKRLWTTRQSHNPATGVPSSCRTALPVQAAGVRALARAGLKGPRSQQATRPLHAPYPHPSDWSAHELPTMMASTCGASARNEGVGARGGGGVTHAHELTCTGRRGAMIPYPVMASHLDDSCRGIPSDVILTMPQQAPHCYQCSACDTALSGTETESEATFLCQFAAEC